MAVAQVPEALAERLGAEGTEGLVTLLVSTRAEWTDEVWATAVERFERRLTTEMSSLRSGMSTLKADLKTEMSALKVDLRTDMSALKVDLRTDMSALKVDLTGEVFTLRQDLTNGLSEVRAELLKWSFLFWVGQLAAVAGLFALMSRP